MLSVLSYNIKFGEKLSQIQNWLKAEQIAPEILCFQEFPASQVLSFLQQFEPGRYCHHYAPAFQKPNEVFGQLTLIDRFAFQTEETFIVPVGNYKLEKILAKYLSKVTFSRHVQRCSVIHHLRKDNKSFAVANTHLSVHTTNEGRLQQIERILGAVEQFDHAIIVGDFNYTSLWRRSHLFELMSSAGFVNGTDKIKTHKLLFVKQQIDYLFHRNCEIREVSVFPIKFSDHYPVLVQMQLLPVPTATPVYSDEFETGMLLENLIPAENQE